jgi:hypothetical protein
MKRYAHQRTSRFTSSLQLAAATALVLAAALPLAPAAVLASADAGGEPRFQLGESDIAGYAQLVQAGETVPTGDDETEARLRFLVDSLEDRQPYARRWYNSWLAVYSGGAVVSAVRAGLADGEGARAENIVSAVKSAIGFVDLTMRRPPEERQGADPVLAMPGATPPDRVRQAEAAEDLLRTNAVRARANRGWWQHVGSLALNLAGGAVLLAGGSPERAAISTGVGIVFGELFIWTQPYGFVEDWEGYRERFEPLHERVSVVPIPGGLALEATF